MALTDPIIALVIVARNRREQLLRTLESLRKLQTQLTWELIVVDNGSTDGSPIAIETFAGGFAQRVRLVYEPVVGAGESSKCRLASAKGQVVAYPDDDCYPADDYLDAVVECFAETPNLGFVSGRMLQGANSAFRRASLAEVDGFDGARGLFLAEELDVAIRVSAAGWHGAYDPRPLVYHQDGRKTRLEAWRLMRVYQRGIGGFYANRLFLDRQLRAPFVATLRSIRKLHSWRRLARHFRCCNRILGTRYAYKTVERYAT
jgi:glycosyltransferase involved in cell wall biosynthesis